MAKAISGKEQQALAPENLLLFELDRKRLLMSSSTVGAAGVVDGSKLLLV
jgi:hypothetical protein